MKISSLEQTFLPFCVDLDGTLVKNSTQWLAFYSFWSEKKRWNWIKTAFYYLTLPKAQVATELGLRNKLSPVNLPYNEPFLKDLKNFYAQGIPLFLATGAPEAIAHSVSDYLKIFKKVFCSTRDNLLIGKAKADALVQAFGDKNFIYAGNSFADIAVWRHAASIVVVNPDSGLLEELQRLNIKPDRVYL